MFRIFKLVALGTACILVLGFSHGFVTTYHHANADFSLADHSPDWQKASAIEIPVITTTDSNGKTRATQLWLAVVDNVGYIRTGNTRWYRNLQRMPELHIHLEGIAYSCGVTKVEDPELSSRVDSAFYQKYTRRTEFFHFLGVKTERILALDCQ